MSEEIKDLVDDLGWDYDRMSEGGKETYKKLCLKLGWEFETEETTWVNLENALKTYPKTVKNET